MDLQKEMQRLDKFGFDRPPPFKILEEEDSGFEPVINQGEVEHEDRQPKTSDKDEQSTE